MNQSKKITNLEHVGQFNYLGRWVDKSTFRAFVYDKEGNQKLANNYQEFESLTRSGIYFASKPEIQKEIVSKERKQKNGPLRAECN